MLYLVFIVGFVAVGKRSESGSTRGGGTEQHGSPHSQVRGGSDASVVLLRLPTNPAVKPTQHVEDISTVPLFRLSTTPPLPADDR